MICPNCKIKLHKDRKFKLIFYFNGNLKAKNVDDILKFSECPACAYNLEIFNVAMPDEKILNEILTLVNGV